MVEMIDTAETINELNEKEKYYIKKYRKLYGRELYNIASGGDGGNTVMYMSPKQYANFINKMTLINTERARKPEYRNTIGQKVKDYYNNHPKERETYSKRQKAIWTPEMREKHSKLISARPHEVKAAGAVKNQIKCIFELNSIHKEFDSIKLLREFLSKEYNYRTGTPQINSMLENGAKGIPYKAFHKKYSYLNGMIIYRIKDKENVSTSGDECSRVEQEISTCPKSEAME